MVFTLPRELDPLDREIVEKALQAWFATRDGGSFGDLDSDEALEAELRYELIGIARSIGVSEAETLLDVLLDARSEIPR